MPEKLIQTIETIYEATFNLKLWPYALSSVAKMAGSAGASFRREGRTDWSRVHGPMAENMAGYFNHYWRSDLFVPAVRNARPGEIVHLLKTFDRDVLLAN